MIGNEKEKIMQCTSHRWNGRDSTNFFADTTNSKRQVKEKLGHVVHTNVCRFAQNVNSKFLFFSLLDKDKNNFNTN